MKKYLIIFCSIGLFLTQAKASSLLTEDEEDIVTVSTPHPIILTILNLNTLEDQKTFLEGLFSAKEFITETLKRYEINKSELEKYSESLPIYSYEYSNRVFFSEKLRKSKGLLELLKAYPLDSDLQKLSSYVIYKTENASLSLVSYLQFCIDITSPVPVALESLGLNPEAGESNQEIQKLTERIAESLTEPLDVSYADIFRLRKNFGNLTTAINNYHSLSDQKNIIHLDFEEMFKNCLNHSGVPYVTAGAAAGVLLSVFTLNLIRSYCGV